MKTFFQNLILTFFFLLSLSASADWTRGIVQTSSHRAIHYERYVSKTKGPEEPVLLLLPGIFRGFLSADKMTPELVAADLPFILMHFAEQADSVVLTPHNSEADFSQVDLKTLTEEVSSVAAELRLRKVIPVTISYSGLLTQALDPVRFPVVIEVAPMAKDTDEYPPALVQYYEWWETWVKTMPYGAAWLLNAKKVQLGSYWRKYLNQQKNRLPQLSDDEVMNQAVQGYTALSLAADGFDLRKQDFKKGPQRFFILGEQESPYRAEIQNEAVSEYQRQTGHNGNVVVIKGAGHLVPIDQPAAYVGALKNILQKVK